MVKISESAIKIVIPEQAEVATTLEPKRYWRREQRFLYALSWPIRLPVYSRHLTRRTLQAERGNPVSLPQGDSMPQGIAYGGAGTGGWKKRMPCCNGMDTGLNVTRHEREPTSDWSYIARE